MTIRLELKVTGLPIPALPDGTPVETNEYVEFTAHDLGVAQKSVRIFGEDMVSRVVNLLRHYELKCGLEKEHFKCEDNR